MNSEEHSLSVLTLDFEFDRLPHQPVPANPHIKELSVQKSPSPFLKKFTNTKTNEPDEL